MTVGDISGQIQSSFDVREKVFPYLQLSTGSAVRSTKGEGCSTVFFLSESRLGGRCVHPTDGARI